MLITGAGGMLGSDMTPAFVSAHGSDAVVSLKREDLDITDAKKVREVLQAVRPTWVVNTAAYTAVDKAERERELARSINETGPAILAEACATLHIKLLHFSTDQVFDGKSNQPWTETDPTAPLNYYAETKLEGERAVLAYPQHLVLRVQWLYGRKKDRFTALRNLETFSPFSDQRGAPTWTSHLAAICEKLVSQNFKGLYHFAHDDSATWAEVFQFVKEVMGYRVRLEPKTTESLALPAKRPLYCVLSNRKLVEALQVPGLGSWQLALSTFLSGVRH